MKFTQLFALVGTTIAFPTITIKENDQDKQLYIVNADWYQGGGGDKVVIPHGGRSYLATGDKMGPDDYYAPNVNGGFWEWDVDLSQSGCSCNAAMYLISMPGKDWNGNPDPSQGHDYYCDANQVGGVWCPEFDMMEANTYAWHSTPHKCDSPNNKGHYSNCDRGGSVFQVAHQYNPQAYGPGGQYTINTQNEFHVKVSFNLPSSFSVELSQGSKSFTMTGSDAGYLSAVKGDVEAGMTVAISNWGTDWNTMKWLDEDTGCQGTCSNPTLTIKNIAVKSNGKPGPGPDPPGPGPYDYGQPCAHPNDGLCGDSCSAGQCKWSWPSTDPAKWDSKDANCRCQPGNSIDYDQFLMF